MKEFFQSLLSRKFLLALGTICIFIANEQYAEAITIILAYLGVEGAADIMSRVKTVRNSTGAISSAPAASGAVDSGVGTEIFTGTAAIRTADQKIDE